MVFNSLSFLVFLAVCLGLHHLPLSWRARKANLLVASSLFYAAWNPLFLPLLWYAITLDWFLARAIAAAPTQGRKKALLVLSLVSNLGLLAFFKYGPFLSDNANAFFQALGVPLVVPRVDVVLPVAISFYTFESLAYTLDVYRGDEKPWSSFLDFSLFLTFFPHLVAGPIVRPNDFLPQCAEERRATPPQLLWGLLLLVLGVFEKTVIADGLLAPLVDTVFAPGANPNVWEAWSAALAFSGQIFCDFAGYSLCAIGVALCFGFHLPDNFQSPYASVGFSDFWRRWHISLSSWLRDYLYISLGGNRKGPVRTQVNLVVTMLLGGLWHGASWTFVVWGGLHGLFLVAERLLRPSLQKQRWTHGPLGRFAGVAVTFVCVCFAWVFFRAPDFSTAFTVVRAMVGFTGAQAGGLLSRLDMLLAVLAVGALLALQWRYRDEPLPKMFESVPWWASAGAVTAMLVALVTATGVDRAFIYFQF
ncbi:MBOAT family O-acyltransferase [Archangium lansingense]|uniref:MBOAT family protein n=1 Tax=Archangium lansingense TaxID=2995310 RepID=A0ABT3ZYH5_9BACT|nr:MBOAT family O-acyltransferase [Archangium lansinium]MCY1074461.1 MBOAT family protein [Archangium lansinium]